MIWPVILSGGAGSRLWPLSRAATPKQMLALAGANSLLQNTALRCTATGSFHAPVVVANAAHLAAIESQFTAIHATPAAVILEPAGRNTAPAIALAAHWIAARDPAGLMLVMPSDHVIADDPAFQAAIDAAAPVATDGWLVTLGIAATHAETGYGYIRIGDEIAPGVSRVAQFVEKPDAATASRYLSEGCYAWNGGIFLMRADSYLAALARHATDMAIGVTAAMESAVSEGVAIRPDAALFARCPSDSIDYAVMERHDRVAVVPVAMGWSDIGSWDALIDVAGRDADGNSLSGDVIALDTHNCLIRSEGPLVAAVGTTDLTIVATGDAVLVAAAGHSQRVKAIVDRLAASGRREHLDAARLVHPWGVERILARGDGTIVSEYLIEPGKVINAGQDSGTVHVTVLSGQAGFSAAFGPEELAPGSSRAIPLGMGFAIANTGGDTLRVAATIIRR